MAIDLGCIGQRVAPVVKHYDWRDVALYALALGAGEHDLPFVLNQPAPKVLTVRGIWDMKVGALLIVDTETAVNGELAAKTSWQLLLRGEGGFGGERPPGGLRTRAPKDKAPDFEAEVSTSRNQALLYRLTGDLNPIHSHPEVAKQAGFDRPILHGLCTYGIAGRMALKHLAGDEPARFKALETKFSKVVMPGDTLIVRGYKLETAGQAAVTVTVKESGEEAIANGLFEYTP
jgi:acyl dehydratase